MVRGGDKFLPALSQHITYIYDIPMKQLTISTHKYMLEENLHFKISTLIFK